jgi:hypothetical protein
VAPVIDFRAAIAEAYHLEGEGRFEEAAQIHGDLAAFHRHDHHHPELETVHRLQRGEDLAQAAQSPQASGSENQLTFYREDQLHADAALADIVANSQMSRAAWNYWAAGDPLRVHRLITEFPELETLAEERGMRELNTTLSLWDQAQGFRETDPHQSVAVLESANVFLADLHFPEFVLANIHAMVPLQRQLGRTESANTLVQTAHGMLWEVRRDGWRHSLRELRPDMPWPAQIAHDLDWRPHDYHARLPELMGEDFQFQVGHARAMPKTPTLSNPILLDFSGQTRSPEWTEILVERGFSVFTPTTSRQMMDYVGMAQQLRATHPGSRLNLFGVGSYHTGELDFIHAIQGLGSNPFDAVVLEPTTGNVLVANDNLDVWAKWGRVAPPTMLAMPADTSLYHSIVELPLFIRNAHPDSVVSFLAAENDRALASATAAFLEHRVPLALVDQAGDHWSTEELSRDMELNHPDQLRRPRTIGETLALGETMQQRLAQRRIRSHLNQRH